MRRTAIAIAASFMVALTVAQPVSAEVLTTLVFDDGDDVPYFWDTQTGEAMTRPLNGNQAWVEYGYVDMTSYWLSQDLEANTYTFGMEVAAEFPQQGDAMPSGVKRIDWVVWLHREPFNWAISPEDTTEYIVNLTFDGTGYSCSLVDYIGFHAGNILEDLDPSFDGTVFRTSFSGGLMDDDFVESFYWTVSVRVTFGTNSCLWADSTDWYVADDQVWDSIPWPPVEP